MARVTWEGVGLAESDSCVVIEGNYYFPHSAIRPAYFKPCSHTTVCSWKGTAHYYDIEVNGKRNPNAAWHYPAPSAAAKQIKARISDLKLGDKGVEDMHRLCSCVNRAQGSLPEVDTQWVRAKISPFNSPSTVFCASVFKEHG